MADALASISTRRTPQNKPSRPEQVKNSAGGYVFVAGDETQLRRFLVLGTTGGTYYTGEKELTAENAAIVIDWARNRGAELVRVASEISLAGRAVKQNPAIFALAAAMGLGDAEAKRAARAALPDICRTATSLFIFVGYVQNFRGWGRGLKSAVADWYTEKPVGALAYQMTKYRSRNEWSHRDVLRLAKPQGVTGSRKDLLAWATGHSFDRGADGLRILDSFLTVQSATDVRVWVSEINRNLGLTWEMLPSEALKEKDVWAALIGQDMPITALIRQLPRLTRLGLLNDQAVLAKVLMSITSKERLHGGRVHPMAILTAMRTYGSGHSFRGDGVWVPNRKVIDALDAAFYEAFKSVVPTGKRTFIALDISGSMGNPAGESGLTCREASAAMAMITLATEDHVDITGFTSANGGHDIRNFHLADLDITPRRRLDDIVDYVSRLPMGGTDCALPMIAAANSGREVDTFVVFTDNETHSGRSMHPHQALELYRQQMGIDAKLVVCALTPTPFTIADPKDAGMLDIVGLDSAVPTLISDFSRGL